MGKRRRPAPKKKAAPKPRSGGTPPWLPAAVVVGVVGLAILLFFLFKPSPAPPHPSPSGSVAANLVDQLTSIPVATLDQVGKGSADLTRYQHVSEPPLTKDGKPEYLYMGAEYCPYCGAQRWAVIVALGRFGTLTGVAPITSGEGNLATFTFRDAAFTSSQLAFTSVETADRTGTPLQTPTAQQSALINKYAGGTIPFFSYGNRWTSNGATYQAATLEGMTWQQVIDALNHPESAQAQGILGSANVITAALCELTDQQPGAVCSDPMIHNLQKELPAG